MRSCRRSRTGTVTLIGATTENPSFEVNAALLSRSRVLILKPLSEEEIGSISAGPWSTRRGLAGLQPAISPRTHRGWPRVSEGDARVALAALEAALGATRLMPTDSPGHRDRPRRGPRPGPIRL